MAGLEWYNLILYITYQKGYWIIIHKQYKDILNDGKWFQYHIKRDMKHGYQWTDKLRRQTKRYVEFFKLNIMQKNKYS